MLTKKELEKKQKEELEKKTIEVENIFSEFNLTSKQQEIARQFSTIRKWKNDYEFSPTKNIDIPLSLLKIVASVLRENNINDKKHLAYYFYKDWKNKESEYNKNSQSSDKKRPPLHKSFHPLYICLQESIYRAAFKENQSLRKIDSQYYTVSDIYNIIFSEGILEGILNKYKFNMNSDLFKYVSKCLTWRIKDRQRAKKISKKLSPLVRLRTANKKELKEALLRYGVSENDIENRYLLIWEYFKEIFENRKRNNAKLTDIEDVLNNLSPNIYKQIKKVEPELKEDANSIKKCLSYCYEALKNDDSLHITYSLDNFIDNEKQQTYKDFLKYDNGRDNEEREEEKIEKEKELKFKRDTTKFFTNEINKIKQEEANNKRSKLSADIVESIICVKYVKGIKQEDIAQYIEELYPDITLSQSTVSRNFNKNNKKLGKSFFHWLEKRYDKELCAEDEDLEIIFEKQTKRNKLKNEEIEELDRQKLTDEEKQKAKEKINLKYELAKSRLDNFTNYLTEYCISKYGQNLLEE